MPVSLIEETELPGRLVDRDTMDVIVHRYYWASQFISGRKVLEVACGPGLGLGYLSQKAQTLIGGDLVWEDLRLAKSHYGSRIRLLSLDAQNLPFRNGSLDVIICLAAVIYLDLPLFLCESYRVLKKNGILLINTPNKDIPNFRPSRLSRHYYSVPELSVLLSEHGFQVKLSGAFNVPAPLQRQTRKILSWGIVFVENLLRAMRIYEPIRRFLLQHNPPMQLEFEINEQDVSLVENIPVDPIPDSRIDRIHRIIYFVGKSK